MEFYWCTSCPITFFIFGWLKLMLHVVDLLQFYNEKKINLNWKFSKITFFTSKSLILSVEKWKLSIKISFDMKQKNPVLLTKDTLFVLIFFRKYSFFKEEDRKLDIECYYVVLVSSSVQMEQRLQMISNFNTTSIQLSSFEWDHN